ncbi:PEP-CTERM sorting domain-containing protein [Coleofasciculus sp. FACHB-64]|uniref:choice-of-anchor Q domain-containing protein n=1 Tax=Cyanophyceae TaxID=3028117 RepID=UPI0016871445|nr:MULTISPECIES: choice-of-anchor Q domain-containing protein [unclassified Coleofasciculus]MBD1840100.1 PEP-CTERM sorting domain-containing protein [Coleofasciculus sp. FACHB-501]MBD2044899.1 PEP-CTERM sorting domain-containing protein [Coleofasciculus sp. FACHB-64]
MKFFQKLALTAALMTLSINPSFAATFSVTSTADSGAGSLRQAIIDANTAEGDDIIDFLLGSEPQTINLSSGLGIFSNLSILSSNLLSVSGNDTFDIFQIGGGATVDISGLTITNGRNGISNSGRVTLTNTTITSNTNNGIVTQPGAIVTLTNSTVSGNGSRGILNFGSTLNIGNSIIAQNPTDIIFIFTGQGAINDQGYNLIGNGDGTPFVNGVNGNIVGTGANPVDPLLEPLTDNNGIIQTLALLPGSPAIDAANPNSFPATDQRGVTRPQGARADIGAFELAQTPSQPVPEPGTVLGLAGLGLFGLLRKKARFNHQ